MNPGQNPPTTENNAIKQAETAIKTNNEPRGRIRQQQRSNAIKQAETAIKTNNEPRGRIRQQRRRGIF
jgi:hypothetical protein